MQDLSGMMVKVEDTNQTIYSSEHFYRVEYLKRIAHEWEKLMRKFLIVLPWLMLLMLPAIVQAQEQSSLGTQNRFFLGTGNDLLEKLKNCQVADPTALQLAQCMEAVGFVNGVANTLHDVSISALNPNAVSQIGISLPEGVEARQMVAVVQMALEKNPATRNREATFLVALVLHDAWPKHDSSSSKQPTLNKETCAKIAAQPDPFAKSSDTSNDNAICRQAYPDLYTK